MSQQFSFLSWVQNNLVSHSVVDASSLRPVVPVHLNLQVQGGGSATDSVDKSVAIHGPGDVIGLQPEAVLKTTPPAGEQQYSSLLVASIEFLEEDLPWRYSPVLTGGQAGQRAPWCFLLTVREDEFTALPQGSGPLPAIEVKNLNVFPSNVAQTYLWAHVQVNKALTNTSPLVSTSAAQNFLDSDLKQDPDQAFARLLSPRKLEPSSTYHSFLIPAYETGRLAGLGLPVPAAPTTTLTAETSAWAGTGSKVFPVYYQWSFRTGEAGDFETLARRLQAQPIRDFGSRDMAVVTPLVIPPGASVASVERVVKLPGIIQPASPPAASIPNPDIAANLQTEVNEAFFPTSPGSGPYRRPVVAPPAYGRAYVARPAGALSTTSSSWFPQLNLDPSYRALAAVGANIIQDNQEDYMQQAWEQVRDVITANMNLRGMQSGLQTTTSLRTTHLPLTGSAAAISANRTSTAAKSTTTSQLSFAGSPNLPPDDGADQDEALLAVGGGGSLSVDMENYGLHLTGLAFTRVLNPATGLTLQETIRQSRMPLAAFSPTFRRIMKPFGRYQAAQAGRPLRPTQVANGPYPSTLLEPGLSLKQRDGLLALMAAYDPNDPDAGGITGARPKERTMRGYQFDDDIINKVLSGEVGKLTEFWYFDGTKYISTPVTDDKEQPGGKFTQAFASFGQAQFTTDESVKPALDLSLLKQLLIQGTRPGPVYLARANRALRLLPHYQAYTTSGGISTSAPVAARGASLLAATSSGANAASPLQQVQPIMAYPVFKEPMSEKLRQRHPELFLPKIGDFPANVVTLLSHNHAFIEAYMVGLNHAFGSELLWREYPADLQGTYFRQFWDVSEKINASTTNQNSPADLASEEEANRDITPISSWGTKSLGTNYPALNAPQLTLAVRADLLQRFPNTVICAVPAKLAAQPSTNLVPDFTSVPAIKYPAQRTTLGQDIILLSFNLTQAQVTANNGYFFVFHERPGEPQFGLDDAVGPLADWDNVTWQQLGYLLSTSTTEGVNLPSTITAAGLLPLGGIDTSAKWAYALFQKPFMVAIHATQMLIP